MTIENFGPIAIFESQEEAEDGVIMTLTFDNRKKLFYYRIKNKIDNEYDVLNMTFRGNFELNTQNKLKISLNEKKDMWYGDEYNKLKEPMVFEMKYKINGNKISIDKLLFDIQWGDMPSELDINEENCYSCFIKR